MEEFGNCSGKEGEYFCVLLLFLRFFTSDIISFCTAILQLILILFNWGQVNSKFKIQNSKLNNWGLGKRKQGKQGKQGRQGEEGEKNTMSTHNSQLTTHNSQLSTHNSALTTQHSALSTQHSALTTQMSTGLSQTHYCTIMRLNFCYGWRLGFSSPLTAVK